MSYFHNVRIGCSHRGAVYYEITSKVTQQTQFYTFGAHNASEFDLDRYLFQVLNDTINW